MYAITLHQPWASLIALGIKTVETRSWAAPGRLLGQTIAIHAGRRVVRQPGECIERELRARLGEDWVRTGSGLGPDIPTGAVLATATLAAMARVEDVDLTSGHAVHDVDTEMGCAVGRRTNPHGSLGRLQRRPLAVVPGRRDRIAETGTGRWPSGFLALVTIAHRIDARNRLCSRLLPARAGPGKVLVSGAASGDPSRG